MSIRQMELFREFDCYRTVTGAWITQCRYCNKTKLVKDPDEQPTAWRTHLEDCPFKILGGF